MKKVCFLFFVVFPLFCFSQKITTKSFYPYSNPTYLNGTYLNKDKNLSQLFSINSNLPYFITFEFNGKDSLKIIYQTESGLKQNSYKGKFKKNYFEVYFAKKKIPIPFFWIEDIDRIRIGHNENFDLLIQQYDSHMGWVLFLAGGGSGENEYSFQNIHNIKELKPYLFDNKWGYTDSIQNVVIEPQYDFVEFFNNGASRVKQNDKWGLINDKGIEIAPIKYDTIYPFNSFNMAKILVEDKKGYLDINGKEIIPPIYDEVYFSSNNLIKAMVDQKEGYLDKNGDTIIPLIYDNIGSFENSSSIVFFLKNGKYGYRTMTDVICPPIFDKANNFSARICSLNQSNQILYGKVSYKGESYLVDADGNMYKFKCQSYKLTILEESKIKVEDLENKLSNP